MGNTDPEENRNKLDKYLSPLGVWAISIGTTIGWGSFVITGNTYLAGAGPLGSILGMALGAVVMLIIARNYHYMMQEYPDAGGAYTYTKKAFGFDYGFLTAWFLALTYVSIFWANVTSLPIFAGYFLGDLFRFGFHYSIFGYEIYAGEILLSMAAIILAGLFSTGSKKIKIGVMIALAIIFTAGIAVCFTTSVVRNGGNIPIFNPAFIPDKNIFYQVLKIACISPWAFIGFENVSHSAEEMNFPRKKVFGIFAGVIIISTLLYIFIILLSITAFPPRYSNWLEYIRDHGNLSGLEGLPPFYSAYRYMANMGVFILILTLAALVITSLLGNLYALSRLIYGLSRDGVMPSRFQTLNRMKNPYNAIRLVVLVSLIIPFFGRTAVGWIVDVTTLGATMIYGFVSGAAFVKARESKKKLETVTGAIGSVVMIFFVFMLLIPNFFSAGAMATESYFLFGIWAIVGLVFFRRILIHDHKNRRFGKTGIVWVVLLMLILMTSLEWVKQLSTRATESSMEEIIEHYGLEEEESELGSHTDEFIREKMSGLVRTNNYTTSVTLIMFTFAAWIILSNQAIMVKRETEHEKELGEAKNVAYTDPLTGVKSKAAYAERETKINARMKDGSMEDFAVVVCDINGLKEVNDSMGHKAGDELIKKASHIICDFFKRSPVFRVGGDEFVVILTGTDYEGRQMIMESLNRQMERNKKNYDIVIAVGVSEYEKEKDKGYHDVFERADALMYMRKKELKS